MINTSEQMMLAEELELLAVLLSKENTDSDAGLDDICKRAAAFIRATSAPAAVREVLIRRIELARAFIADEYTDPAQEPKGDWIAPEARPAHDALCLCMDSLSTPEDASTAAVEAEGHDAEDRMEKISALIGRLQETKDRWGDTCVYIRRGGLAWGAVALNRQADDKKHGIFDLQAQHDRDMLERLEQIERLKASRDRAEKRLAEVPAALSRPAPAGDKS